MNFICEPELREYMERKGMRTIAVEVVTSDYSDFEIFELHVHLVSDSQAKFFRDKKRYRGKRTDFGEVLLPPFRLEISDTVTFGLKKVWVFHSISYKGIKASML